jgi:hypothetical protein
MTMVGRCRVLPFPVVVLTFVVGVISLFMAAVPGCRPAAVIQQLVPADLRWILVQHFPAFMALWFSQTNDALWAEWEAAAAAAAATTSTTTATQPGRVVPPLVREIPSIDLSGLMIRNAADDDNEIIDLFVARMARQLGTDWRRRPLLLKGLWSHQELQEEQEEEENSHRRHPQQRRLSLAGLLEQGMVVPYFYNATTGAVTPDAMGRIRDIVHDRR